MVSLACGKPTTHPEVQLIDLIEKILDGLFAPAIVQQQEAGIAWCHKGADQ